ncbi:Uncharacterised protein [Chlamydia trachomatis]|nr:Uncharacterised protein [Chlamydia trachomatis]
MAYITFSPYIWRDVCQDAEQQQRGKIGQRMCISLEPCAGINTNLHNPQHHGDEQCPHQSVVIGLAMREHVLGYGQYVCLIIV